MLRCKSSADILSPQRPLGAPRSSNRVYASSAYPGPPELPKGLSHFGAIKSECFLWCMCPADQLPGPPMYLILSFLLLDVYTLPVKFKPMQFIFNVLVSFQGHKRLFRPYLFECIITFSELPVVFKYFTNFY